MNKIRILVGLINLSSVVSAKTLKSVISRKMRPKYSRGVNLLRSRYCQRQSTQMRPILRKNSHKMLVNIYKEDRESLHKEKQQMIITRSRLLKWKMKKKNMEMKVTYLRGSISSIIKLWIEVIVTLSSTTTLLRSVKNFNSQLEVKTNVSPSSTLRIN